MRHTLSAPPPVVSAVAVLMAMAGCDRTTPSTSDPGTTPNDWVTAPAPPDAPGAPPGQAPLAASPPAVDPGSQGGGADWRVVASEEDAARLARLDEAWRQALVEAQAKGHAADIRALGPLGDPDAGLPGRLQPPPGDYRCRTVKLGSTNGDGLGFVAYPGFRCRIELSPGGDLGLTKLTGSQRVRGLLYPDTDARLVFVGAEAWSASETGYPAYGDQAERDRIGVFERIGEGRWRLVQPFPRQESKLDLLELTR